ncbi:uncharacterized protein LOC125845959 [Solanum stenotomum]|uniref:uncharacterized protein LOC125845959 n=1 Tax=Solanum stenotomum TaxID=172797 RepID=UPI0020D18590|nr:uncharacterized protein LOC125845959 [Solanum stenotomum]
MIERAVATYLAPIRAELRGHHEMIDSHRFALNSLIVRVEVCEQGEGASADVTTLKADIVGMRRYDDELKSTDLSMLFGTIDLPEVPSADVLAISEIPQATTTGDVARDDVTGDVARDDVAT